MKKKLFILGCLVLLIVMGLLIKENIMLKNSIDEKENEPKVIKEENTLSMMIEQTAGAGDYKMETRSSWPTDGYVFNTTLSKCENGGELAWDDANSVVTMTGNVSDKCYVYFEKIPTIADACTKGNKLASCIINLADNYDVEYTNIYHHDGTLKNGINDGSYRYAGVDPSNYVCFGSTASPCPTDNLYRIIGVFGGQVKLIKSNAASSALLGTDGDYGEYSTLSGITADWYYWNYKANGRSNIWSTSLLNTTNLNTNFINSLGSTWSKKIATTTWKVGGNTQDNISYSVPSVVYESEITNSGAGDTSIQTEYSAKIGLMYVSDYAFASVPNYWTTVMWPYDSVIDYNWLAAKLVEWTITRVTDWSTNIYRIGYTIDDIIHFGAHRCGAACWGEIRPTFYLNSSVTYSSGTGTSSAPIILS